jgi:hypothetical protein
MQKSKKKCAQKYVQKAKKYAEYAKKHAKKCKNILNMRSSPFPIMIFKSQSRMPASIETSVKLFVCSSLGLSRGILKTISRTCKKYAKYAKYGIELEKITGGTRSHMQSMHSQLSQLLMACAACALQLEVLSHY